MANKAYMKKWVAQTEAENQALKQEEAKKLDKIKAIQSFQIGQMQATAKGGTAADHHFKKKFEIGGLMSDGEVRMNRELLKEIAMVKKMDRQPR